MFSPISLLYLVAAISNVHASTQNDDLPLRKRPHNIEANKDDSCDQHDVTKKPKPKDQRKYLKNASLDLNLADFGIELTK